MSSQQLSKVAVGITKAVEDRVAAALPTLSHPVSFSRSVRDVMVLSIQKRVRRAFTKDVLFKHSKCFAPDLLSTITDAAAKKICRLFSELLEESLTTIQADLPQKPTSAVVPPPTPPNEPPANISPDQILCPEPAVSPPPPPPLTPEVIVTPEVAVLSLDVVCPSTILPYNGVVSEHLNPNGDNSVLNVAHQTLPISSQVKTKGGIRGSLKSRRKDFYLR